MRLIAHRGFADRYPENTLRAVREASRFADEVEVDVRRCDSGELVVVHDCTVDRVTDEEGAVAHHSLAELRALDVLGTGEGVPTLAEVLSAVPPTVWIVSKPSNWGWPRYRGLVEGTRPCALRNCSDRVQASKSARDRQIVCEA